MKIRTLVAVAIALSGSAAMAEEYEKCFITPAAQVGFVDTFTSPGECVEACKATEGCDSWTFIPHSFDKSIPGQCKLIDGAFKLDPSDKTYCGKI